MIWCTTVVSIDPGYAARHGCQSTDLTFIGMLKTDCSERQALPCTYLAHHEPNSVTHYYDYTHLVHRQCVMRTPLDVIMDVESELALHGYADPSTSLFRGCHLCFLPLGRADALGKPANIIECAAVNAAGRRLFQSTSDVARAAAATQTALEACQARRVLLQVKAPDCVCAYHITMYGHPAINQSIRQSISPSTHHFINQSINQ